MKAVIKSFLAFTMVLFLFYIIGALSAADLNLKNWDSSGRGLCFAFGGLFALATAGFVYAEES